MSQLASETPSIYSHTSFPSHLHSISIILFPSDNSVFLSLWSTSKTTLFRFKGFNSFPYFMTRACVYIYIYTISTLPPSLAEKLVSPLTTHINFLCSSKSHTMRLLPTSGLITAITFFTLVFPSVILAGPQAYSNMFEPYDVYTSRFQDLNVNYPPDHLYLRFSISTDDYLFAVYVSLRSK